MKYAHDYLERMALTDGTPILLRTLYPTDKQNLADGMRELSFLSRYERFFTPKHGLSDSELVFLTEMDEINHYAIGAGLLNPDGSEGKGLGVARFVRDVDDAQIAEPAVTVLDAWQGKGLGKLLLHHVGKAAKERGIEKFRSLFLAENQRIRSLLLRVFPETEFIADGTTTQALSLLV